MNRFTPDDISSAQLRLMEFVVEQVAGKVAQTRRKFERGQITSGDAAEVINKLSLTLAIITDPNGSPKHVRIDVPPSIHG